MEFMFDWDGEGDRFSFEDSDRFEEDDSLCSWISEPDSLCNNWRGWRKQNGGQNAPGQSYREDRRSGSLVELAAQAVACHIPFEVVEHFYPPIPEQLQLRIAFWSFAENEEDIRLYSCLANGSADEFQKGEHLYKARAVKDALQIGFHLSATVVPPQTIAQAKGSFNVAVVFDRRRITSCNCTCSSSASWCAHVVALCLYRIHQASQVCLRAPVSESLSRLHRDQLQKFAQYLISELPQQILPTAQRLLDELLSSQQSAMNTVCGAPDPTAGPSASEQTTWCLDEATLHENIKKTLIKFCVPSPIVFSDVNYLSSTAPPAAAEWQSLLRPLRGREPEGMWNLLSIVREMYRRNDSNAFPLLDILTEEVLACEQILLWWFSTKISASHNSTNGHGNRNSNNTANSSQNAASSLCDEIVALWRLAALNPTLSPIQRDDLCQKLKDWHIKTIDKIRKGRGSNIAGGPTTIKKSDIEIFSGFKVGIEACQLDWTDYVIPGVTYTESSWRISYTIVSDENRRGRGGKAGAKDTHSHTQGVVSVSKARPEPVPLKQLVQKSQESNKSDFDPNSRQNDGACSSSSEGFCENDRGELASHSRDSDSSLADEADLNAQRKSRKFEPPLENAIKPKDFLAASSSTKGTTNHTAAAANASSGKPNAESVQTWGEDIGSDASLPGPSGYRGNEATANQKGAAAAASGGARADALELQPSSADEYQVYFYDTKAKLADFLDKKKKSDEPNYFAGIRKLDNKQEILFARAEALHAHGFTREACWLAQQLAEEMLANPPDLTSEPILPSGKKQKKKKAQQNISSFASTTLAKAAFLCNVLLEDCECHHLAFKVGMFGLEMPRPPASSKALEVKLANQESELVTLLKKIPLGLAELNVIRDRAEQLRDGKIKLRGEALLPLMLASFIFDSLCLPTCPVNGPSSRPPSRSVQTSSRSPSDEKLGFEAAVAALGLKANVSEADHPLLCEGTRRQRGDLAIAMLVHYKDDPVKLSKLMDKLLDKEIHQLYKAPSLTTYLSHRATANQQQASRNGGGGGPQQQQAPPTEGATGNHHNQQKVVQVAACHQNRNDNNATVKESGDNSDKNSSSSSLTLVTSSSGSSVQSSGSWQAVSSSNLDYLNLEQKFSQMSTAGGPSGARPKIGLANRHHSKDTDSSAVEEEGERERSADYKAWEAKFRCTNLKSTKKHSVGMASIDSSAPETTSSDNSPTLVRRNWAKHQGPGSDSGSSGKSSDSLGSSSSGDKGAGGKNRDDESPPCPFNANTMRFPAHMIVDSRSSTPNIKGTRFKGKNRAMPTIPNQPSEASAHFMFELAKNVLAKAGGTSSTSLFTQPSASNSHSGPHRALHLCAFQLGLYALGLHNCVTLNWLSRTYSSHVSWITGQAMEIGSAAINILIDTWEGHLTPPEAATLADRASRGRDPNMVRAAAELALSCLPHAHALNPNEIQRALIQCKEQSRERMERACLAVESAAQGGGVYPEGLFDVARKWYELYEETVQAPDQQQQQQQLVGQRQQVHVPIVILQEEAVQAQAIIPVGQQVLMDRASPPTLQMVPYQGQQGPQGPVHQGQAGGVPIPYTIPPPAPSHPQLPHHPYVAPYSYMQTIHTFGHHYSQPHIPLHTHNIHPAYMATYPYQTPSPFNNIPQLQNIHPNHATLYHANAAHLRPPPPTVTVYTTQPTQVHPNVARSNQMQMGQMQGGGMDLQQQQQQQQVAVSQAAGNGGAVAPPGANVSEQNSAAHNYLLAAYRVGMLAMETLARRVHDDRPLTKYARNPPHGEDVKWLLSLAMKLGTSFLQQFCASAVNAVVSPFVLHDIAIEAAHFLSRNNPAQVQNSLRSPTLNSLVQKCIQMFIQCTHQRMHHITQADYDEFVGIVCSARNAFCMTPGGMVQFNELLQSLRRSKSCKKELWQRIVNGLATGNI